MLERLNDDGRKKTGYTEIFLATWKDPGKDGKRK